MKKEGWRVDSGEEELMLGCDCSYDLSLSKRSDIINFVSYGA